MRSAGEALATVQVGVGGDDERLDAGVAAAEEVLPVARQHGDGTAEAFALMALAWACRARGLGCDTSTPAWIAADLIRRGYAPGSHEGRDLAAVVAQLLDA